MSEHSWGNRLRWLLTITVSLATLGWTLVLLRDALPGLSADLPRLKAYWLMLPLFGCIACGYIGFEAFRALLLHTRESVYKRLALGHLFFVAQLMKHLPGRVWGVAYQAAAGRSIGLSVWASVTVTHMVIATGTAAWMSLSVMGFSYSPVLGTAAILLGAVVYFVFWNRRLLGFMLKVIGRVPGKVFIKIQLALRPFVDAPVRFKLHVLLLFAAYWLVYLVSWAGYGFAWPGLRPLDGLVLCALYTAAWLAGYFSLITPSGMGVRELVFVFLAHRFPADAVAGLAIFGRFMLLLADLVLGGSFAPFLPRTRLTEQSHGQSDG